jgi:hypothetical protein
MSEAATRASRWDLLAASGGAIFALLYATGFVMQGLAAGGGEQGDESRAEIVARYSDAANEVSALLGGLLVGVALFFVLPFLATLRATLRAAEGERAVFSTAALVGGVLMAALFAVSGATSVAAFSTYDAFDAYRVDPDAVLLLSSLSFYALGYAVVGGGVLVGATSVVALKARLLPRWLAASGLVLAFVLMFGHAVLFVFLPLPLLVLWVLVISVVLFVRARRPQVPERDLVVRGEGQPA